MGLGDLYELIWSFENYDNLYQTAWHFLGVSGDSDAEALSKVPTTFDVWGEMRKMMSEDITLLTCSAKRIRPEPSEEFPLEQFTFFPAITGQSMHGARIDTIFDTALAACVTLRTSEPSRRGRGRWYWGAVPTEWASEGRVSTNAHGLYTNNADNLLNFTGIGPGGAAGFRWSVWSPNSPEPDGEWTQNVFPIMECVISRNWAYLRSRKLGVGQ